MTKFDWCIYTGMISVLLCTSFGGDWTKIPNLLLNGKLNGCIYTGMVVFYYAPILVVIGFK